jgi:hypothetical protein
MKFLIKFVMVIGILVLGGAWIYGRGLPREHIVASSITLTASPDTVFKVIRNIQALPDWWDDAKSVTRLQGYPRETWAEDMGMAGVVHIEITSVVPGSRLVTTIVDDEKQGWGGVWRYEISSTGAGTEVHITEEGYVNSPIFRVIMNSLGKHRTVESYLRSLGAHFGEMATPRRG